MGKQTLLFLAAIALSLNVGLGTGARAGEEEEKNIADNIISEVVADVDTADVEENDAEEEFSPYISLDELMDLTPSEIAAERAKAEEDLKKVVAEVESYEGKTIDQMSESERSAARYMWEDELFGSAFFLKSVNGEALETPRPITIQFSEDGEVAGRICNEFRGHAEFVTMMFKVPDVMTTKMMCPDEELAKLENEFIRNLRYGISYQLSDGELELRRDNMVLIFRHEDSPDNTAEEKTGAKETVAPVSTTPDVPKVVAPEAPVKMETPAETKPEETKPEKAAKHPEPTLVEKSVAAPLQSVAPAVAPVVPPAPKMTTPPLPAQPKSETAVSVIPVPQPVVAPVPQAVMPVEPVVDAPLALEPDEGEDGEEVDAGMDSPLALPPMLTVPGMPSESVSVETPLSLEAPKMEADRKDEASVGLGSLNSPPLAMPTLGAHDEESDLVVDEDDEVVVTEKDLAGRKFVLAIVDGDEFMPKMGEQPFIQFDVGMQISGKACNSFRGRGSLEGNILMLPTAASTMMMCGDELLNQYEMDLYRLLREGMEVELFDEELILHGDGRVFVYYES